MEINESVPCLLLVNYSQVQSPTLLSSEHFTQATITKPFLLGVSTRLESKAALLIIQNPIRDHFQPFKNKYEKP
jgi:hypothetical protein